MQVDLDALDQNAAVNKAGQIVGQFAKGKANEISDKALQPYDEVFGLQRFRETELIHGRWVHRPLLVEALSRLQGLGDCLLQGSVNLLDDGCALRVRL